MIELFVLILTLNLSKGINHTKIGDYSMINTKTCGLTGLSKVGSNLRVVSEHEAVLGEFPFMASIISTENFDGDIESVDHYCGGAVITSFWVLSAANCFNNKRIAKDDITVLVGSVNRDSGKKFKIKNIVINEEFKESNDYNQNDIALIEVENGFEFENQEQNNGTVYAINNICLPKSLMSNNNLEIGIISGFGSYRKGGGRMSDILRKANYSLLDPKQCEPKLICNHEQIHALCFGDAGSPLIQFDGDRAVLIGIFSKIVRTNISGDECGPGKQYFTRVSYFVDWIIDKISKSSAQHSKENPTEPNKPFMTPFITIIFIIIVVIITSIIFLYFVVKRKNKSMTESNEIESNTNTLKSQS